MKIQFFVHTTHEGDPVWISLSKEDPISWCSDTETPLEIEPKRINEVMRHLINQGYSEDRLRVTGRTVRKSKRFPDGEKSSVQVMESDKEIMKKLSLAIAWKDKKTATEIINNI